MKRRIGLLCILLVIALVLPGCDGGNRMPEAKEYYVRRIPASLGIYGEPEYMLMDDFESAKEYADENVQYGCIVVNEKHEFMYAPYSQVGSEICYQAKIVCDYIRDKGFTYGNASINPAFDCWEKIVSCDRLVDWVLYRVGYTDQPYNNGKCVSGPWLTNWCIDQGFKKISKISDLLPGDVVFVRPNSNGDPLHTFIYSGEAGSDGIFYRYDAGSNTRIQSTQPSRESIGEFMYAYRAPKMPAKSGVPEPTPLRALPTFKPKSSFEEVWKDDFSSEKVLWDATHDVAPLEAKDGVLSVKCKGTDPYIIYFGELDLNCEDITKLRIRYKNGTPGIVFQVFWKTNTMTGFSGDALVSVDMARTYMDMSKDEWIETEINLKFEPLWKGTLTGLRIDPTTTTGDFQIDFISFGR